MQRNFFKWDGKVTKIWHLHLPIEFGKITLSTRLVPIKMKSMVMTSYVLAIIIWSILAQTNPSKLSIILKFVNKNISTNHQRGKLSTNQGRPFIFADICCCFEKKNVNNSLNYWVEGSLFEISLRISLSQLDMFYLTVFKTLETSGIFV